MKEKNTRVRLIEAGIETLLSKGFNGTAVQDIADAAGILKGSFYNHFKSKELFALEALDKFWEIRLEQTSSLKNTANDPVARLKTYFQSLSEIASIDNFSKGCLIGNFSIELSETKSIHSRLKKIYGTWIEQVESCIHEAVKANRCQINLPPSEIASFLINSWEGSAMRAKIEKNKSPFDHFERIVFSVFFT